MRVSLRLACVDARNADGGFDLCAREVVVRHAHGAADVAEATADGRDHEVFHRELDMCVCGINLPGGHASECCCLRRHHIASAIQCILWFPARILMSYVIGNCWSSRNMLNLKGVSFFAVAKFASGEICVQILEGGSRMDQPLEAQLRATLNMIPAYTWYATPSGGLIFVNERNADYLGSPSDHPLRYGTDTAPAWDSHIPFSIRTTKKRRGGSGQSV